jgi:hypothetical protein
MDMPRNLQKAIRVLGPFDSLTSLEGREEKSRKRQKRKEKGGGGRMDEVFEVLSRALDL